MGWPRCKYCGYDQRLAWRGKYAARRAVRAGVVFDLDLDVIHRMPAYFDLALTVANLARGHVATPRDLMAAADTR